MSQESNSSNISTFLSQETIDLLCGVNNIQDELPFTLIKDYEFQHVDQDEGTTLTIGRFRLPPPAAVNPASTSQHLANTMNEYPDVKPFPVVLIPSVPSNVPFQGVYHFEISFNVPAKDSKCIPWTYSEKCAKLYTTMAAYVPIQFRASSELPDGCYIRATPIFARPEYVQEVVKRCPTHVYNKKYNEDHKAPEHLIRSNHISAIYVKEPGSGRLSVMLPACLRAGSDWVTEVFQFMCLSSCSGGINRRAVKVVFTLEFNNEILGRQAVEVRICCCPGRDKRNDERNVLTSTPGPTQSNCLMSAPSSTPGATQSNCPMSAPSSTLGATQSNCLMSAPSSSTASISSGICVLPSNAVSSSSQTTSDVTVHPTSTVAKTSDNTKVLKQVDAVAASRKRVYPTDDDDDETFNLSVCGRNNFRMLSHISKCMMTADKISRQEVQQSYNVHNQSLTNEANLESLSTKPSTQSLSANESSSSKCNSHRETISSWWSKVQSEMTSNNIIYMDQIKHHRFVKDVNKLYLCDDNSSSPLDSDDIVSSSSSKSSTGSQSFNPGYFELTHYSFKHVSSHKRP